MIFRKGGRDGDLKLQCFYFVCQTPLWNPLPALVSSKSLRCKKNTVQAKLHLFYPHSLCRIIDENAGVNRGGVGSEPPCPPDWLAAFARALIFHCNRQCNILSCQSDSPPLETVQDSNHINHPSTSTITTTNPHFIRIFMHSANKILCMIFLTLPCSLPQFLAYYPSQESVWRWLQQPLWAQRMCSAQ